MSEDDELKRVAERVFRQFAIEHLCSSVPEFSIASSYAEQEEADEPPPPPEDFLDSFLQPHEPSTRFAVRVSEETGLVEGVDEVARDPEEFGAATSSTSLKRGPSTGAGGIRGSSSNIPFSPGGIDDEIESLLKETKGTVEDASEDSRILAAADADLIVMIPGLTKIADFLSKKTETTTPPVSPPAHSIDVESADLFELMDFLSADTPALFREPPPAAPEEKKVVEEAKGQQEGDDVIEETIDAALSSLAEVKISEPASSVAQLQPSLIVASLSHANVIRTDADLPEFAKLEPIMAKKYPFRLDPFQQAAVVEMEKGESVFVAAHTSAGKTAVAEYAVALCKAHKTRAIYTSPIKALSNQKYRDFRMVFEDVGLVTGDIQLNPEAFCLIMTTEILRSMLYNGSEVIRELEWVVFDEVHYINDAERGHVWEEVLIMLPKHVNIVMLSATVPNCDVFADWVGRIKHRKIGVVSTQHRPVPLEHFIYTGQDGKTKKDLFLVIEKNGEFNRFNYAKAVQAKQGIKQGAPPPGAQQGAAGRGGYGGGAQRGGGGWGGPQARGGARGGGGQAARGGGGQGARGGGGGGRYQHRGGGSNNRSGGYSRNDKNIYLNLIDHLRTLDKLPLVCFVFSRKRCDENAQLLSSVDLTTAVEKSHVTTFFAQCTSRLKGSDKELPQLLRMRELCLRGFAVHHSGVLPILKEVVEILFQKGYVKILFATETFAMGVNMPARTVVFDAISKHDGHSLRPLHPAEYIQMAGRAGRRGLDSTGTVIVLIKGDSVPDTAELTTVMKGKAAPLESRFRVTYSMLLNVLRAEQLRVEDMLRRSFVEQVSLREDLGRKSQLEESRKSFASMPRLACSVCGEESEQGGVTLMHDHLRQLLLERAFLWQPLSAAIITFDRAFSPGRLLILTWPRHCLQNTLAVLLKEESRDGRKTLQVLVSCTEEEQTFGTSKAAVTKEEEEWEWEEGLISGTLSFGLEGVAPPAADKKFFRILCDLPQTAVIAVCKSTLKVDVSDLLLEEKRRGRSRLDSQKPLPDASARVVSQLNDFASQYSCNKDEGAPVILPSPADFKGKGDISLLDRVNYVNNLREHWLNKSLFPARHCAKLQEHMTQFRTTVRMQQKIRELEHALSSESLQLSEEYRSKVELLRKLGYLEQGDMVSFKGRVACEIHHQELLITELILDNSLYTRDAAEIAAMLSATTCQHKGSESAKFPKDSLFDKLRTHMTNIAIRIQLDAKLLNISIYEGFDELRFDLMEVVYNWAQGMPFAEIMSASEAQEGIIVRCIQRLGEVCKDIRNAARVVGNPALQEKMEQVSAAIKRDIVFAASLYTTT